MARYICVILLLSAIAVCLGCEERQYSIVMTPQGDSMERTISFSNNLSFEEQQAIANSYPKKVNCNTFSGTFKVEMPNDVGCAGFYTYLATDMGCTSVYRERFRGNDDIKGQVERIDAFVERLVDFTINWFEFELGSEPNFDQLRTFLDKNVRTDAKNAELYFWLNGVVSEYNPGASDEFQQRIILYLEEKGYIEPGGAEILMQKESGRSEMEVTKLVRDIITREMGYNYRGQDFGKLSFLDNSETIENSMKNYIRSTQRYRQMWEQAKMEEDDPNLPPPKIDVYEFIDEGNSFPFEINLWASTENIEVCLKCPCKPFRTNGFWQDVNNQVYWSGVLHDKDALPTFCYASWSEPNRDFQLRHFGRVILDNENLAQYCFWGKSIEAGQAEQWNEFISGIDPNMEIEAMVKAFRFTGESNEPNAPTLAEVPRSLIINSLSQQ
jgi:hypothetical protein